MAFRERRQQQSRRGSRTHTRRGRGVRSARHDRQRLRQPRRTSALRTRRFRQAAHSRLQRFRQATALTVALTALLLLVWGIGPTAGQENPTPVQPGADGEGSFQPDVDVTTSLEEATSTVRDLLRGFFGLMPKVLIALLLLLIAYLLSKVVRLVLRHFSRRWEMIDALSALVQIALVLLAIGAGLSVIAGDARALVGSVGLIGLALSWALQTPIESFTGWVLNAFRSYYRVGDRVEVGEVYGDVYRIDILTTTVWQVGGPGKPVAASQSTGALVTFPNWEVLRSNIINYSRDFPYVWDEVTVGVTNESDLRYTVDLLSRIAEKTVGDMMIEPAEQYRRMLKRERLDFDVSPQPQVYLSLADAWTDCTVRYLVPVRERRKWSSALLLALSNEMARPEHAAKIEGAYPRTVVDLKPNEPPNA